MQAIVSTSSPNERFAYYMLPSKKKSNRFVGLRRVGLRKRLSNYYRQRNVEMRRKKDLRNVMRIISTRYQLSNMRQRINTSRWAVGMTLLDLHLSLTTSTYNTLFDA